LHFRVSFAIGEISNRSWPDGDSDAGNDEREIYYKVNDLDVVHSVGGLFGVMSYYPLDMDSQAKVSGSAKKKGFGRPVCDRVIAD
jgi:hypothetical protein